MFLEAGTLFTRFEPTARQATATLAIVIFRRLKQLLDNDGRRIRPLANFIILSAQRLATWDKPCGQTLFVVSHDLETNIAAN